MAFIRSINFDRSIAWLFFRSQAASLPHGGSVNVALGENERHAAPTLDDMDGILLGTGGRD
jgi:hypothetical protein